jgi:hypothetical protein
LLLVIMWGHCRASTGKFGRYGSTCSVFKVLRKTDQVVVFLLLLVRLLATLTYSQSWGYFLRLSYWLYPAGSSRNQDIITGTGNSLQQLIHHVYISSVLLI